MTSAHRLLLAPLALAAGCTLLNDPTDLEPGPDTAGPATPQSLAAHPGIARMVLTWDPVTDWDFDHYVVYYAETTQSLMRAGQTAATAYAIEPLDNGVVYDFMVLAVDRFGNVSVPSDRVTAQPDGVAPTVVASYNPGPQNPANTMTDVIFTFSEPMDAASVEASATVSTNATNPDVACVWSWYTEGREAKCDLVVAGNPSTPLEFSKEYTVRLGAGAADPAGNPVAGAPIDATFTTAGAPDLDPPALVSITVSSYLSQTQPVGAGSPGAAGVFPETRVAFTFDEPMSDALTANAITVTGGPGYNGGAKSWNAAGTVLTFDPDVDYPTDGRTVTVAIATGPTAAQDFSGNQLPPFTSRTFRIAFSNTVTLTGDPARDGYVFHTGTSVSLGAPTNYVAVGDAPGAYSYRGYVSFNRAGLPQTPSRFTSATLAIDQYQVTGTPYDDLDQLGFCHFQPLGGLVCSFTDLLAVPVELDATGSAGLDALDYDGPAVSGSTEIATSAALGYHAASVLAAVEADRTSGRSRSEWRLQFPVANDGGGDTDLVYSYPGEGVAGTRPTLTLTYEYP